VKVFLVPSTMTSIGAEGHQYLTSFLVNDTVAIDAGSIGLFGTPQEQARVKHVFLSHTHIDHVASLPLFVENVYEARADCVTVYGSDVVLDCLQRDVFNNRIWPDFIGMSAGDAPFLKLQRLESGKTVHVDGLRVTPVAVDHAVPTMGFIVADDNAAVVFPSDTGPTDEIWALANQERNLKAVFLEVTFPDEMAWLAALSKHHTPATFARDVQKLRRPVQIIAIHLKPASADHVVSELEALGLPNLELRRIGHPYYF
jgi:ribonuclease BN (tRNA processing enzyme)